MAALIPFAAVEPENVELLEARDPLELLAKAPNLNMFSAGDDVDDTYILAVSGVPKNARLLSPALSDSADFAT